MQTVRVAQQRFLSWQLCERLLLSDFVLKLSSPARTEIAAAMKKGFLLTGDNKRNQDGHQPAAAAAADAKCAVERQKHDEVQQPAASADVKGAGEQEKHEQVQPPAVSADVRGRGAVEQRYTQAEINHFVAQLQTMRALGLDSYITESGMLFDQNELEQIIRRYGPA